MVFLAGADLPVARAQGSLRLSAANLSVVQFAEDNATNSLKLTTTLAINDFRLREGSNRGDYNVQIGASHSDDVATGVIMTSVAENGRDNGEPTYPGINYCTTALDYSRSGANAGAFYLPVFNAPAGAEYNINLAAAFFPYTNWLAGYARNSGDTNGGANDLFTGSPGLVLGTHFVDQGNGISIVNLTSRGVDSRTDGVLLVTHGENEDNYALSQVNSNNGTWTVYVKDNGSDAGATAYEQDPVAFVFIPRTNTAVISGRFRGDGTRLMFSGDSPQFNVVNTGAGTWRLTIPGHSPGSGVLILAPEGGLNFNQDNMVSYQPDGDGWLVQSRDLPGGGLQTPGAGGVEPVASFVFIPAPRITLVAPENNAQNQSTPTLKVAVSNNVPGDLSVSFYGRVAPAPFPGPDFAIVALPDTQYYSAERFGGLKEMFIAQTEWVITNRISRNIAYVAHLGDIVDSGDIKGGGPNLTEWRNATNAMYRLENPVRTQLAYGVPYGVAVGNHEQEPIGDANGTTILYNQYFGFPHFNGRSYYAGRYGTNNNNHFDFFSAGGLDFIVLYFEYDTNANPAVLAWGNEVLRTNAHRRAIVVSHYLGRPTTPSTFSPQGAAIYNALRTNANLFLMLSGHVDGEGSRVDTFNGRTVRTLVSDYQFRTNGGNGLMRILDFSPSNNVVVVTTYSPWTDEYETDADSEFFFSYNLQPGGSGSPGTPFALLATNAGITPGGEAAFVWPGLQTDKTYEWYVAVTDAAGNTVAGPTWQFVTAPNSPPFAGNLSRTIYGDAPTNLTLLATDPNGDALTFQTRSVPTRGVLSDFDAAAGTVTYSPARGYRGGDRFTFVATDRSATSSVASMNLNVVAPPDSNANGLPDAWEAAYGVNQPDADADGDGRSNLDEYLANTNPTNAASVFEILSSLRQTNGHFKLIWSSVGGTRYRVQFGDGNALSSFGGVFTDIVRQLTNEMDAAPYGLGATQSFTDDFTLTGGPPTNGARHYRVRLAP